MQAHPATPQENHKRKNDEMKTAISNPLWLRPIAIYQTTVEQAENETFVHDKCFTNYIAQP